MILAALLLCWPLDADTMRCDGMQKTVRLAGIDAAELFKPACTAERRLAEIATLYAWAWLAEGRVTVTIVGRDKYHKTRVLGRITRDGRDLGGELMAAGLARRWTGRRLSWCS